MKKRFTEEQIIGFLREAEAGMPVAELCRKHAFEEEACSCGHSAGRMQDLICATNPAVTENSSKLAQICHKVAL